MSNRIRLGDDGTLDTVLICNECGAEARYNYDPATDGIPVSEHERNGFPLYIDEEVEDSYRAFVEWAVEDFDSEHECDEPEE